MVGVALAGGVSGVNAQSDPADVCATGWLRTISVEEVTTEDVAALSESEAWAVGGTPLGGGKRGAAALRFDGLAWTEEAVPSSSARDAAFMAVDAAGPDLPLWAVGYEREPSWLRPFVARRDDGRWTTDTSIEAGPGSAALADVAVAADGEVWAVGFVVGKPGQQDPLALRQQDGRWEVASPALEDGERGMLSSVAVSPEGGTWAAGTVMRSGEALPLLVRRTGAEWIRQSLPEIGEASIADIDVPRLDEGWAVGHRLQGSTILPLVLRWDGISWSEWRPPTTGSAATILTGISAAREGAPTVAGSFWDEKGRRFRAMVARWGGTAWDVSIAAKSLDPSWLKSVDGDPTATGWIAGVAGGTSGDRTRLSNALLTRLCEELPSGQIGGAARDTEQPSDALQQPEVGPQAAGSDAGSAPAAPIAASAPLEVRVVDVAATAGLPTNSTTWGAVVADFDADGRDDIFLGRHGKRARLYLGREGGYVDSEVRFKGGDRHGCAAADLDGSGLPDLYCSFGALRGTGIKGNQLWLDPGGTDPQLHPAAGGALEPFGRGRFVDVLDLDGDGVRDLLLAQEPNRPDAMVSASRAYIRTGPAQFESRPLRGFDESLNAEALESGDVDGDGRIDVLLVYDDPRAAEPRSGFRLYLNRGDLQFADVTSDYEVLQMSAVDAALVPLDGDSMLDLVQLSSDRIVISLQREGRFEVVFERSISSPVAVAVGDADGDGDQDVYVLRDKARSGGGDLILLNDGDGRSFSDLSAPDASGGGADDVFAIDYDQDGTTEFLALNGRGGADGPLQLISVAD